MLINSTVQYTQICSNDFLEKYKKILKSKLIFKYLF